MIVRREEVVRDEGAVLWWRVVREEGERWCGDGGCFAVALPDDSAVLGCGAMLCPSHKCGDLPRCQVAEPCDLMQVSEHLCVVRALQESKEE